AQCGAHSIGFLAKTRATRLSTIQRPMAAETVCTLTASMKTKGQSRQCLFSWHLWTCELLAPRSVWPGETIASRRRAIASTQSPPAPRSPHDEPAPCDGQGSPHRHASAHFLACASTRIRPLGAVRFTSHRRSGRSRRRGDSFCHTGFANNRKPLRRRSHTLFRRPQRRRKGSGSSTYFGTFRASL